MITNSIIKHNFYKQSGAFSFLLNLSIDNTTGILNFGFSGDAGKSFNLECKSGKFVDHKNNYIDSYAENIIYSVSGNVDNNSLDYFINNNPASFGLSRPTGHLDYFYIDPQNCTVDFDLFIQGEIPDYIVICPTIFNSGITNIPITITNNSFPFKIFSGFYNGDKTKANVSGIPSLIPTGITEFYIRQSGLSGNVSFPVKLQTNFGDQLFTFLSYGS